MGNHDKYTVKVDGSGRLTVRNRRFLRPMQSPVEVSKERQADKNKEKLADQTKEGNDTRLVRRSDRLARKTKVAAMGAAVLRAARGKDSYLPSTRSQLEPAGFA